jgi:hypothetical protein
MSRPLKLQIVERARALIEEERTGAVMSLRGMQMAVQWIQQIQGR